ncbi:hypothetical protein E4U57_006387 [Claviceps arundinis]|uniref:Uncharacterized protein n=1 Tax=Claviceps arundinis TaxID=1623583 RepID=A0A9P7N0P2_9HYPO|nr:hypothetical protein E4U57_006387 [Claviceps arundinis]KAG5976995.1 hypothetical protein E4U56_000817 [Claviceps arundinis]
MTSDVAGGQSEEVGSCRVGYYHAGICKVNRQAVPITSRENDDSDLLFNIFLAVHPNRARRNMKRAFLFQFNKW